MDILQVIPYFVPAWSYGGSLQVAYRLSKELVKRGHGVTVYTTDTLDASSRVKEKEEAIDGIKVKRFRNLSKILAHKHHIFLTPGMLPTISKEISNFDVIHVHEHRTIQSVIVHHYAKKHGIPYIIQAHGALPRVAAKQKLKHLYDTIWGNNLLKDATKAIALTETEMAQYHSVGVSKDKIEIVPNGIDLSEFENLPERGEFRSQYGLAAEQKIILYLGRIHATKGLDLLVRAFSKLFQELDTARLIIVGPDDGYAPDLTRLKQELEINNKVLLPGPIYERNRLAAYVDADVFVTPSFLGFPITLVEACACGTPIITTEKSDRLDWIRQTGYVAAYDENALKDAMARILTNKDLAQQFGENGKRLVRERFNWSRIAEEVENIYLAIKADISRR